MAARQVGDAEAWAMVRERPRAVIENLPADRLQPAGPQSTAAATPWGFVRRWLRSR
jgi:hypothetical protein